MDVGGRPAQSLSEFYAAIFAQILQASQSASKAKFEHAIDCVRNVRDAWREVARDPNADPACASRRSPRRPLRQLARCRWQLELDRLTRRARGCSTLARFLSFRLAWEASPAVLSRHRQLFFELLLLVEARVIAVQRQQFVVPAQLDDPPLVQHGDAVGVAHRRHAMRDQNRGRVAV